MFVIDVFVAVIMMGCGTMVRGMADGIGVWRDRGI